MLSLRLLGRAAPRCALRTSTARSLSSLSRQTFARPSWQSINKPSYPTFSTSIARREPAGDSDQVLSEKLSQELALETESRDASELPASLKEFLDDSSWKLQEMPGAHDVALVKEFGNEQIKVEFSFDDMIDNAAEEEDMEDDAALSDEDFQEQKQTINQSGTKGGSVDVVPEDSVAPVDRGEAAGQEGTMPTEYPLTFHITITKPGDKMIEMVATAQDGTVGIDRLSYALPKDIELEEERRYSGPPITSLDADLQNMFELYLEQRGIDANLAQFAYEYNEYKEQREYVDWLQKLKDFVDT